MDGKTLAARAQERARQERTERLSVPTDPKAKAAVKAAISTSRRGFLGKLAGVAAGVAAATVPAAARPRRHRDADPLLIAKTQPPDGITGADSTSLFKPLTVKLDWLNLVFPVEHLAAVRELVSGRQGQAEDRLFGYNTYSLSCQWDDKAILCWSEGRPEAWLSLNGDSIDRLDAAAQLKLIKALHALGAKGTRVDAAADDWQRMASMDTIQNAGLAGDFTRFEVYSPNRVYRSRVLAGDMACFGVRGSNGSGKYLRIYDKFLESKGEVDCIRYEVEFNRAKAAVAFNKLAACEDVAAYARTLGELVGGAIDFRKRAGYEKNIQRAPRLEWWARILEQLGEARISIPIDTKPLEKTAKHMLRQWGPTVALLQVACDTIGVNFGIVMEELAEKAAERINWKRQEGRDLRVSIAALLDAT
jgi:DNA relaxase NicK